MQPFATGGADRPTGRVGVSNPEIGARLFISPRTVEGEVFTKLGISARKQLHGRWPTSDV